MREKLGKKKLTKKSSGEATLKASAIITGCSCISVVVTNGQPTNMFFMYLWVFVIATSAFTAIVVLPKMYVKVKNPRLDFDGKEYGNMKVEEASWYPKNIKMNPEPIIHEECIVSENYDWQQMNIRDWAIEEAKRG